MLKTQIDNTTSATIVPRTTAWLLASLLATTATAGDWPQILGPQRNGIASDERLADTWPETGPRVAWTRPV